MQHFIVGADGEEATGRDRNRLGTQRFFIHGQEIPVVEDQVGLLRVQERKSKECAETADKFAPRTVQHGPPLRPRSWELPEISTNYTRTQVDGGSHSSFANGKLKLT